MFFRLSGNCLTVLVLSMPVLAQEKPAPAKERHYARAEIRGELFKPGVEGGMWTVMVGGQKKGEGGLSCPLIFLDEKTKRAAKELENKMVTVTGKIRPNPSLGGIGGESHFIEAGPMIEVRTLRSAGKRKGDAALFDR